MKGNKVSLKRWFVYICAFVLTTGGFGGIPGSVYAAGLTDVLETETGHGPDAPVYSSVEDDEWPVSNDEWLGSGEVWSGSEEERPDSKEDNPGSEEDWSASEFAGLGADAMPVELYINDGDGSSDNTTVTLEQLSGSGWSYDPDENVLTLNGFHGSYLECSGNLTVYLKGTNTLTIPSDSQQTGISMYGSTLTINSDAGATLTVSCNVSRNMNVFLIRSWDTYLNGGTLILTGSKTSSNNTFYGADTHLYVNNNAELEVDIDTPYSFYGVDRLYADTSGNISVTVRSSTLNEYAVGELYATGSGDISISVPNGCRAIGKNLEVGENAGDIDISGPISAHQSSMFSDYGPAIEFAGNKAITNHITGGYYLAGKKSGDTIWYYLCDLSGNPITDAQIRTISNQSLTVMGSAYRIPALKVGNYYSGINDFALYAATRGGKLPYTYELKAGSSLPAGLSLNRDYGYVRGTPTAECGAGSAVIVVTDGNGTKKEVTVQYGAVTEEDKFIKIGDDLQNYVLPGTRDEWSYTPATGTTPATLTLDGYDGGPIIAENTGALTLRLRNYNAITIPATTTENTLRGLYVSGGKLTIESDENDDAILYIDCTTAENKNIKFIEDQNGIELNSGELVLTGSKTSSGSGTMYGTLGNLYVNNSADFDLEFKTPDGYYAVDRLYANTSADLDLSVDNSTAVSDYVVGTLVATGSGKISIEAPSGGNCIGHNLEVGENAGDITFSGPIAVYRSGFFGNYGSAIEIAGNKAVTNHTAGGYYWAGNYDNIRVYLTDANGDKIDNAKIATVTNQPLTVMGSGYSIPLIKIGQLYTGMDDFALYAATRGGKLPYTYTLKEDAALPAWLHVNADYGYVYGTPDEESPAGTVTIVVTDAEDHTVEVPVSFAGSEVAVPVSSMALDRSKIYLEVGSEAEITATVTPGNATNGGTNFTVTDENIAYIKPGSIVNTGNITKTAVVCYTAGKTRLNATTAQGGKKAYCDVWVKEQIPAATYTVDADGIRLSGLSGYAKYSIKAKGGTAVEKTAALGYISLDNSYLGKTIEIVKINDDADLNSAAQELTIAAENPDTVLINMNVPVKGYVRATLEDIKNASPKSSLYSITTANMTPADTKYEEGTVYTLTATVTASGALTFADSVSVKLNGEELNSGVNVSEDRKTLMIVHAFPATAVTVHVTGITLTPEEFLFTQGTGEGYYTVSVLPNNAENSEYSIQTADTSVAVVDKTSRKVTPKAPGHTTLTVTTEDGAKTDVSDIYVRYKKPVITWDTDNDLLTGFDAAGTYTITPNGGISEEASISESGTVVVKPGWYKKTLSIVRTCAGISKCDSEPATVEVGDRPPITADGLHARFRDADVYTYTGSAIKPAIEVYNNGILLHAGKDYTVKYSGNTDVKRDKSTKAVVAGGKITVLGKGNLSGSADLRFTILPRSLGSGIEYADGVSVGTVNIVKNSVASPVIVYGTHRLTSKEFRLKEPSKKYTESGYAELSGIGNYTGDISVPVTVVAGSRAVKNPVATVNTKSPLYYDPTKNEDLMRNEIKARIKVYDPADKKKKTPLTEGSDYFLVYPSDVINAGTRTVTVVGMGAYTGTVKKKITIKPLVVKTSAGNGSMVTNAETVAGMVFTYKSGGVTLGADTFTVDYRDRSEVLHRLVPGSDYKLSYTGNKTAGTGSKTATYKVTFTGNYKGTPALKNTKKSKPYIFRISRAPIANADGVPAAGYTYKIPDVAYSGKAGTYKSSVYVMFNGATFKSSNYKVTFYSDEERTKPIGKKNKIKLADEEESRTVYVSISGKGNYDGTIRCEYAVRRTPASVYDMSKARVTIYKKGYIPGSSKNKKLTSVTYNGKARKISDSDINGTVVVEYKLDGKHYTVLTEDTDYRLVYLNNTGKGTAVILIEGLNSMHDGKAFVGARKTTFKIVSHDIRDMIRE